MPETITYIERSEGPLMLHIHRPETDEPRPAIVFFFGGGWSKGTPEQFYPQCEHLARRGMVAISAEYRVANVHGVEPFACLADAKSAMRYVRAHAAELGIDPARIAAGGGSAGGHLAAATTLVDGFDDDGDDLAIPCHAEALVLFNPVLDNNPDDGFGAKRLGDRWEAFSPAHHVGPDLPPTILFLGDRDSGLKPKVLRRFQEAMTEAGNRCDLLLYGGQPHGFFNRKDGDDRYFTQTLTAADAFLVSLGWLPERT